MRKKVVSPDHRRAMARKAVEGNMCSGRAACRFLKLARSTWRYRRREAAAMEERLGERLRELSGKHPRYGYRRIAALLRPGRLGCGRAPRAKAAEGGRTEGATDQAKDRPARPIYWAADEGGTSWTRLDLGLHLGCDHARRSPAHVDHLGRAHPRVPCAAGGPCLEER
ncbi:hypothetical protein BH09VER1_BH09VER1_47760 [soil metagenome]